MNTKILVKEMTVIARWCTNKTTYRTRLLKIKKTTTTTAATINKMREDIDEENPLVNNKNV